MANRPTDAPQTTQEPQTRRVPPFHVILLNDDHHSCEFVVRVLRQVFGFPEVKATELMWHAHTKGQVVIWTGPREVAELKVDQIRTYHEKRDRDQIDLGPLDCLIEPAPGG